MSPTLVYDLAPLTPSEDIVLLSDTSGTSETPFVTLLSADQRRLLLQEYDVLDTQPDTALDQLVRFAASICQASVALISLADSDRLCFKARWGMQTTEMAIDDSFCYYALTSPGLFVVPDASLDPRFADSEPVAGEAGIRFYAGMPLRSSDNCTLGTLCVLDQVPRTLTATQQEALTTLGRAVMDHLELKRTLNRTVQTERALRISQEQTSAILTGALDCIITIDHQGCVLEWNPAAERTFGYTREQAVKQSLADLIIPPRLRPQHEQGMQHYLRTGEGPVLNRRIEINALRADGSEIIVELAITPIQTDPFTPPLFTGYLRDISEQKRTKAALQQAHDDLERRVAERTAQLAQMNVALRAEVRQRIDVEADVKRLNVHLLNANQELTQAYDTTIEGWARVLDMRDRETEGHSRRVTEMSVRLAEHLALSSEERFHLRRGALLHDIGKMAIPDHILLKPGPLDASEWEIMRRHPTYARDMLMPIDFLYPALDIPYCHHEKWDGTGYPQKLKGEAIPLAARIFSVVDVWDALRSDRPYRPAWPQEKVRQYLREQSGLAFDPDVVRTFLATIADARSGK